MGDGQHTEQVGDRDGRDECALDQVAADDQPPAVAAIGDRTRNQSEQQIRHDAEREQRTGLRRGAGDLVDDQRQDDPGDRAADHRHALCRGPTNNPRLAAQRVRGRGHEMSIMPDRTRSFGTGSDHDVAR